MFGNSVSILKRLQRKTVIFFLSLLLSEVWCWIYQFPPSECLGKNGFKVSKELADESMTTIKNGFSWLERTRGTRVSWVFVVLRRFYFFVETCLCLAWFLKGSIVRDLRIRIIWWPTGSPLKTMKSKATKIPPCFLPFFPCPFSPLLSPCSNHKLPFLRTGELADCLLACWPQLALYHCKGMHEFSRSYILSFFVLDTQYLLSPLQNHLLFSYQIFFF